MVLVKIKVNQEEKDLYVDGHLHEQIENKIKVKVGKKDNDWVWIIDGTEGSGKSVLAQQLAKLLDPSFNIDRMCMSPKEFTKAVLSAKKGQCVVFDEAFTGLSSRASLTEINKLLVSLMMEMRQKNLYVIIVMPTFFLLDRYVALFRARGLIHVYLKNGKRGRWVYFNNKKKKLLYLQGKKLFNYSKPKSKFRGRFYDNYTIDEALYREKKAKALMEKSRSTKAETFRIQRDKLLFGYKQKMKLNDTQLFHFCKKECNLNLSRRRISEIMLEIEKKKLKEQIEKEQSE